MASFAICHRCSRAFVIGWQCLPILIGPDGRSEITPTREVGHLCAACYAEAPRPEPLHRERSLAERLAQTADQTAEKRHV